MGQVWQHFTVDWTHSQTKSQFFSRFSLVHCFPQYGKSWPQPRHSAPCQPWRSPYLSLHIKYIYGNKLEQLIHTKYLDLTRIWNWHHFDTVVNKGTPTFCFVHSYIHSCPKSFNEVAYKSLVHPLLEYGVTVWDLYT